MTKAELQKSHDDMVRFLLHLLKFSDERHNGYRTAAVEAHYQFLMWLIPAIEKWRNVWNS